MAFRVAGPDAASTLAYLREREQVTAVLIAAQAPRPALDEGKARPPHQRAVAEHPEI
jgi:cation transport regulator ChaC